MKSLEKLQTQAQKTNKYLELLLQSTNTLNKLLLATNIINALTIVVIFVLIAKS